jgi:hypothetical protein
MVSGKRLWVSPETEGIPAHELDAWDARMAAADGRLVAVRPGGRLARLDPVDGHALWEAQLRGQPADWVRLHGLGEDAAGSAASGEGAEVDAPHAQAMGDQLDGDDVVLVGGRNGMWVAAYSAVEGRLITRIEFARVGAEGRLPVAVGDVLIGVPRLEDEGVLAAYSLRADAEASGRKVSRVWHWDRGEVRRLFPVGRGLLGVMANQGRLLLVDARTGEARHELVAPEGVLMEEARWRGDDLLLRGVQRDGDVVSSVLALASPSSGTWRWMRQDLSSVELFVPSLDTWRDCLAVVAEPDTGGSWAREAWQALTDDGVKPSLLTFIDVSTGENIGGQVEVYVADRFQAMPIPREIVVRESGAVIRQPERLTVWPFVPQ